MRKTLYVDNTRFLQKIVPNAAHGLQVLERENIIALHADEQDNRVAQGVLDKPVCGQRPLIAFKDSLRAGVSPEFQKA